MKQDLHVFTGKGGVGKSVTALAYAKKLARLGEDVLLVELADNSYYQKLLGRPVAYEPSPLSENLAVSKLAGIDCLKEYIAHLVKVRRLSDLFFDNKVMGAFVDAAPGLKELAVLGKLTSGIRQWGPPFKYRHIVIDAYSSGHFMALLKAPLGLSRVIDMGPMGEQTRSIFEVLKSSAMHYFIVTLPEEMPTAESIELATELEELTGHKAQFLVNKHFDTNQIHPADHVWQQEFNQHMSAVGEKMSRSNQLIQSSGFAFKNLDFIKKASPKDVAEKLVNCDF